MNDFKDAIYSDESDHEESNHEGSNTKETIIFEPIGNKAPQTPPGFINEPTWVKYSRPAIDQDELCLIIEPSTRRTIEHARKFDNLIQELDPFFEKMKLLFNPITTSDKQVNEPPKLRANQKNKATQTFNA